MRVGTMLLLQCGWSQLGPGWTRRDCFRGQAVPQVGWDWGWQEGPELGMLCALKEAAKHGFYKTFLVQSRDLC